MVPLSILIIDDSPEDRTSYRRFLRGNPIYDFSFTEAGTLSDGIAACRDVAFDGVLLDNFLPDGEGVSFFEKLPCGPNGCPFFTIMLTGQGSETIAAQALSGGATDYLPKRVVDADTLAQAIHSAHERFELRRKVEREQQEKDRVIQELRIALDEVKRLSGLLPICAHCKSVRKDDGYWQQVEGYFSEHVGTQFSHGICPDCLKKHYDMESDEDGVPRSSDR